MRQNTVVALGVGFGVFLVVWTCWLRCKEGFLPLLPLATLGLTAAGVGAKVTGADKRIEEKVFGTPAPPPPPPLPPIMPPPPEWVPEMTVRSLWVNDKGVALAPGTVPQDQVPGAARREDVKGQRWDCYHRVNGQITGDRAGDVFLTDTFTRDKATVGCNTWAAPNGPSGWCQGNCEARAPFAPPKGQRSFWVNDKGVALAPGDAPRPDGAVRTESKMAQEWQCYHMRNGRTTGDRAGAVVLTDTWNDAKATVGCNAWYPPNGPAHLCTKDGGRCEAR